MNPAIRKWLFLLIVVVLVLVIDQGTKRLIITHLRLGESFQPIPALAAVFQITRSENNGAAFGVLPQAGDLFLIVALVVVVVMLIFYPRIAGQARLTRLAVGLIIGGALGNAFDRVTLGGVVDFILYRIPATGFANVSNLADHAIVLGVLIIVAQSWRSDKSTNPGEVVRTDDAP